MDEKDRKELKENWKEKWRWGFVALCVIFASVGIIFFFIRFQGFSESWNSIMAAIAPIVVGLVIAYLINPLVNRLEAALFKGLKQIMKKPSSARKLSKGLSIAISILLLVAAIVLLIWSIIPSIVDSVSSLMKTAPTQVQKFIESMEDFSFEDTEFFQYFESSLTNITDKIQTWATDEFLPQWTTYLSNIATGVYSVARGVINFIIGIIVAIYVLAIKDTLKGQSKKIIYAIFKPKTGNVILETARKSSDIFGGFISGKIIDSAIIGVICYFGCLILKIPQPVLIAVIIGVTNVIPVFGPFIGAVPTLFIVLIQSPIHALYLLIFILILQQVDGNVIGPKILGDTTGLSTFWVMFAILLGSALWGVVGMLIGVPIFGVIYYIVKQIVAYWLRRKGMPEETADYINASSVDEETLAINYPDPEAPVVSKRKKRKMDKLLIQLKQKEADDAAVQKIKAERDAKKAQRAQEKAQRAEEKAKRAENKAQKAEETVKEDAEKLAKK